MEGKKRKSEEEPKKKKPLSKKKQKKDNESETKKLDSSEVVEKTKKKKPEKKTVSSYHTEGHNFLRITMSCRNLLPDSPKNQATTISKMSLEKLRNYYFKDFERVMQGDEYTKQKLEGFHRGVPSVSARYENTLVVLQDDTLLVYSIQDGEQFYILKKKMENLRKFKDRKFKIIILDYILYAIGCEEIILVDLFQYRIEDKRIEIPTTIKAYLENSELFHLSVHNQDVVVSGTVSDDPDRLVEKYFIVKVNLTGIREVATKDSIRKHQGFSCCVWQDHLYFVGGVQTIGKKSMVIGNVLLCYSFGDCGWKTQSLFGTKIPDFCQGISSTVDSHYIYLFGGKHSDVSKGFLYNYSVYRIDLISLSAICVGAIPLLVTHPYIFVRNGIFHSVGGKVYQIEKRSRIEIRDAKEVKERPNTLAHATKEEREKHKDMLNVSGKLNSCHMVKLPKTSEYISFEHLIENIDDADFTFRIRNYELNLHKFIVYQVPFLRGQGLDEFPSLSEPVSDIQREQFDKFALFLYRGYFEETNLGSLAQIYRFSETIKFSNLMNYCVMLAHFAKSYDSVADMFLFRDERLAKTLIAKFELKNMQRLWLTNQSTNKHPKPTYELTNYINLAYGSGYLSDITLCSNDDEILVHKCVLNSTSLGRKLVDHFEKGGPEEMIRQTKMIDLKWIGRSLYLPVNVEKMTASEILSLAKFAKVNQLQGIERKCWEQIHSRFSRLDDNFETLRDLRKQLSGVGVKVDKTELKGLVHNYPEIFSANDEIDVIEKTKHWKESLDTHQHQEEIDVEIEEEVPVTEILQLYADENDGLLPESPYRHYSSSEDQRTSRGFGDSEEDLGFGIDL